MSVFLVTSALRDAANAAAGQTMFHRALPDGADTPSHYVAGWATIPADVKAAVLAAGAQEFATLDAAIAAAGLATPSPADAFDAMADEAEASALADVRALAPLYRAAATALRGQ